jgi:integrase
MSGSVYKDFPRHPKGEVDPRTRKRRNCGCKGKLWGYVVDLGPGLDAHGQWRERRQKRERRKFERERDASDALGKVVSEIKEGAHSDVRKLTVGQYVNEWLVNNRKIRRTTRKTYEAIVRRHIEPTIGRILLTDLRANHIDSMLTRIRSREPAISATTAKRVFALLRAALNAAVKKRLIPYNPCAGVDTEPENRYEAKVYSPSQVATFLRAAEGDRLALLSRLILVRGLRRGEACGVRWRDFHPDQGR